MKPIVAFLQNMWVRDPDRIKKQIAELGEDYRTRVIHFALFRGCVTGRRIEKAFSETLVDQIVWEETTREIAGDPRTIFPAQPEHISAVIRKYQPRAIITFGKIAQEAVVSVLTGHGILDDGKLWTGCLIHAPHPAARQADVPARLEDAAKLLRFYLH